MEDWPARITALEERIAHQDAAIEELNAGLTAQWRTVESLVREMTTLGDRLQDLGRREPGGSEPPPHY